MQLKSLLALASIATLAVGSDVADILDDLNNVKNLIVTFDNAVKGFSNSDGNGVAQLTAISNDMIAITSANDQTTADAQASIKAVTPTPFSESDGVAVLGSVNDIRPIIEDALTQMVAKKSAFEALPINGVIPVLKQDLTNLAASSAAIAQALLAATPADLMSQGNAVANEIGAAFTAAIAAYSTS